LLADLKNTIKHSGVWGLSRVASKALSFVFIPLYTAVYSKGSDSFANINLLEPFWQYLFTICLFGFETTIITHCSTETAEGKKKMMYNFLLILLVNCGFFLLLGLIFKQNFSELILKDSTHSNVIFYCFLICIFESLITIPLSIARLNNKPKLYTIIALSSLFINFFLQIYFVYFQRWEFDFVFIAKFLGPAIVLVFCIPLVVSNIKINYDKEKVKDILNFSAFWTLYAILSMFLNTIDRYILVGFVSKEQIELYGLGYSVGSLTNSLIIMPFSLAYTAIFYRKVNEPNAERYFTKIATYLFFAMIFVSLLGSLFIPEAIKIFARNPQLWDSVGIIRIILFSNCVYSIFYGFVFSFLYMKEAKIVMYYTGVALIFNIAANFIFIRYYGIYASAVLSAVSYLLLIVLLYKKSKNYYFIKLETYKLILLSILYIAITYIVSTVTFNSLVYNIGFKLVLILMFFILLFTGRFFEGAELYAIKGAINKYLKINLFRKN
jgi:O-antigen/teichoic acid export membrane protein